jgi:hypothetical protein
MVHPFEHVSAHHNLLGYPVGVASYEVPPLCRPGSLRKKDTDTTKL